MTAFFLLMKYFSSILSRGFFSCTILGMGACLLGFAMLDQFIKNIFYDKLGGEDVKVLVLYEFFSDPNIIMVG